MTGNTTVGQQRWPAKKRTRSNTGRLPWGAAEVMASSTAVLRPAIVTLAVLGAALTSIPAAHADSVGDAMAPALNGVGIGNNGPVSSAIAQMGQSICPMLVKPGSSLASGAAEATGHGGLAPPIAGFVAGMAIQAQCPGFMTSVANGNMPFPLPGAGGPGLPFGLPGAPAPQPMLPGISPVGGQPLPFPGF